MKISDLLEGLEYTVVQGRLDREVTGLSFNSRNVTEGQAFVCISGSLRDAHDFIPEVIGKGASCIVIEKDPAEVNGLTQLLGMNSSQGITFIKVANARKALAHLSVNWFGNPAKELITIGITGTKGKTTTTYMLKQILEAAGIQTGLIGTIEAIIGTEHIHTQNTTPDAYTIQSYFRRMADKGIKAVVMEVSSQGLMLDRVEGITFDYGVFTNLEPDHIGENEHKDFDDYLYWKSTLFTKCKTGILNADSEFVSRILEGHTCETEFFSVEGQDRKTEGLTPSYIAENVLFTQKEGKLSTGYTLVCPDGETSIDLNMPGMFSVYNSLTAIAICKHFNVSDEAVKAALLSVSVKGRTEIVKEPEGVRPLPFTVMVDYAHNAMALESLLSTLRLYAPKHIITVFGCGGNRAKSRRFEMGEVSARLSDLTVVTSDNPRNEEPMDIINDIITGISKCEGAVSYEVRADRREAIEYAVSVAGAGDIIVVAGKGHEDYQEIKGVRYHMDDCEMVEDALKKIGR